MEFTLPAGAEAAVTAFAHLFTRPVFKRVQALLCGMLLAPAASTLTAALHALGLGRDAHFCNFHRVFNRDRWSALKAAGVLLRLLLEAFAPAGPLTFALDDTIERRRGRKLTARAVYRDPTRSSMECFQKTWGLRWMSVQLLAPVAWAGRVWGLPFLSTLCPSERYAPFADHGRRHKPLTERARSLIGRVCRWIPGRPLVFVADGTYSSIDLVAWCRRVCAMRVKRCEGATLSFITRLRMDAALYGPVPLQKKPGRGRRRRRGARLPTPAEVLKDPGTRWQKATLPWYGAPGNERTVEFVTGVAFWFRSGVGALEMRWVLVRDPQGGFEPAAFLCSNPQLPAEEILKAFVGRWQMEVCFEEARAHLGIDGQRNWSDRAVARTTPARLALFSLVTLLAGQIGVPAARQSAWYSKEHPTFSDALAAVRRALWRQLHFFISSCESDSQKIPPDLTSHLIEILSFAA